jgi:hypothetical protein
MAFHMKETDIMTAMMGFAYKVGKTAYRAYVFTMAHAKISSFFFARSKTVVSHTESDQ